MKMDIIITRVLLPRYYYITIPGIECSDMYLRGEEQNRRKRKKREKKTCHIIFGLEVEKLF